MRAIPFEPNQDIQFLLGKKIHRIIGYRSPLNKKRVIASYILFSDKKTILELAEQDYYTYHDCAFSARHLMVRQDKEQWEALNENECFLDANELT